MTTSLARCAAYCALLSTSACRASSELPDLGSLYSAAAQASDWTRNPVIVIPGILGSRLEDDDGTVVWGAFTPEAADPETPSGARRVALPMRSGVDLAELTDSVSSAGALASIEVELFGLPIPQQAYAAILMALGVGGFRDESLGTAGAVDYGDDHFTCFQFDYDWRRDLPENAARFGRFLAERKAYVERELSARYGIERDVRFDIVAHSMGGLLLRYYLRYGDAALEDALARDSVPWSGADDLERIILVGTPNAGSIKSFVQLIEGLKLSVVLPIYPPAVLGTMPAVYQLLPRERHRPLVHRAASHTPYPGLFDVEVWERNGWGLADPEQSAVLASLLPDVAEPEQRRAIALEHIEKCLTRAEQFQRVLDRPAEPPPGVDLVLVSGDAIQTPAELAIDSKGEFSYQHSRPGDGTVTRASALCDERIGDTFEPQLRSPIAWRQVLFLFTDHLGLTSDPVFTDNVLFLLLEDPR